MKRIFKRPIRPQALRRWALTNLLALVALVIVSILASHDASAQAQGGVLGSCPKLNTNPLIPGTGIPSPNLNVLPNLYCVATLNWLNNAMAAAQRFFFILVGIELAWSALVWTLQKEQLGELISSFILKLMGIFFFYTLMLFGSTWLPQIMQSFIGLAGQVTTPGAPIELDPMVVFSLGTNICNEIFGHLPPPGVDTNVGDYFNIVRLPLTLVNDLFSWMFFQMIVVFAAIISFVVFVSFLIAAAQLIMTLIEAYIMIGAGAVMLGFTGSRWTMSFGEKWIGYAFAIGIKLFVIYVIVALGTQIFPAQCGQNTVDGAGICPVLNAIQQANVSIDVTQPLATIANVGIVVNGYLEIGAAAIIFMMLCQRLPGLAASMMNGSPNLTAGAAISTAMQVAGVITGVAKAAAGAGMAAAGAGAGGAEAGGAGGGAGGGLENAAALGGGVEGGGSMSPAVGLGDSGGGGGLGGSLDSARDSRSNTGVAVASGSNGPGSNGSSGNGSSAHSSSANTSSADGSPANGWTANSSSASGSYGSSATASAASSGNGVGSSQNSAANGASGRSGTSSNNYASSVARQLQVASAIGNGVDGAVSAIAAPLTKFDEGGGGGSVHIGLKLPD